MILLHLRELPIKSSEILSGADLGLIMIDQMILRRLWDQADKNLPNYNEAIRELVIEGWNHLAMQL